MQDDSYDLPSSVKMGSPGKDDKGWTVYTCTEGNITKLTPTGYGGYSGLTILGRPLFFPPAD